MDKKKKKSNFSKWSPVRSNRMYLRIKALVNQWKGSSNRRLVYLLLLISRSYWKHEWLVLEAPPRDIPFVLIILYYTGIDNLFWNSNFTQGAKHWGNNIGFPFVFQFRINKKYSSCLSNGSLNLIPIEIWMIEVHMLNGRVRTTWHSRSTFWKRVII